MSGKFTSEMRRLGDKWREHDAAEKRMGEALLRARELVPELVAEMKRILDRLDAWRDGERIAQRAAEYRDRPAAEAHWNAVQNYTAIIDPARALLARIEGE